MLRIPAHIHTKYWNVSPFRPERRKIIEAATLIAGGKLLAFPTETVYGLGANALNPGAVERIFRAKGRPSDNPLIIHIAHFWQIWDLISGISPVARQLAGAFWPGPLTLVLPKGKSVPGIITAGLDTVAVRMPSHQVARSLIHFSRCPIAAPSANKSGRPSPTTARHVLRDMYGNIEGIVDGGAATVGVESTVLDVTGDVPMILRPGGVTEEQLKALVGTVVTGSGLKSMSEDTRPRSPGMKYKHYSPKGSLYIFEGGGEKIAHAMEEAAERWHGKGKRIAILCSRETYGMLKPANYAVHSIDNLGGREQPENVARKLYGALLRCDLNEIDIILVEAFPARGMGRAVMNRLGKAAGHNIFHVK